MSDEYGDLFEGDPKSLARNTDPETSKEAAAAILPSLGELHRWTARCVKEAPGLTQRELGDRWCPEDLRKIGRRLNECERLGMVRRGKKRKCMITGMTAETWWPVKG